MANWVRLWEDMPNDPKWRVIAKRSGCSISEVIAVFVHMMTNAGANATERGTLQNWSDEDVAAALDIDLEKIEAIRLAMQDKVLADERLLGWEKRQPKREDSSAERAKAWRERTRTQPNATERPDTDTDTDTEQNNIQPPAKRARSSNLEHPRFVDFWKAYPKRDGSNPRQPTCQKFSRYVAAGIEPEEIISGAKRYAAECERNGTEPKFVAQAATWLNQQRWKDYGAPEVALADGSAVPVFANDAEFDDWWKSRLRATANG